MKWRWIIKMNSKKEKFKTALTQLAQFLEISLEIDVYDDGHGNYTANALLNGDAIAQNGEILSLFDKTMNPYIVLDSSIIKPLQELSSLWGLSFDFLENKNMINEKTEMTLFDYLNIIDYNFTLIDELHDFSLALSEDDLMQMLNHNQLHQARLLYQIFETLTVKKLLSLTQIVIDLSDLKEDKMITPDFVNRLQEALYNDNEALSKSILKELNVI